MNLNLENKVCFVSGSSSGIGFAIGIKLLEEGAIVIFNSRSKKKIKTLEKFVNADFISADVSSLSGCIKIENFIKKKYRKLDILVCNVGSGRSSPPGEENYAEWKRMFNINFFSATNLIESLKKLINDGGSILCISSICGIKVTGAPVTYSVSKSALNAYIKNIAPYFAKTGVRINAIALGNIIHNNSVWKKKIDSNRSKVLKYLKNHVALSRLGLPEEAATFSAFILSPLAKFATGTIYTLDGGEVL
jgi:3-oxoacyl-[acyl-carrier protein] reductase